MKIELPNRISRSATQQLVSDPARVFPLLCPVREADWLERWTPMVVLTDSGRAEPDCVFVTPSGPQNAIWYVTRHEPQHSYVEMIKITPDVTACKITIALRPTPSGSEATVTYTHTSLGPEGDAFVAAFSAELYEQFIRDWERRINHFLTHRTMLRGAE